jgi:cytochrome c peroxidase
MLTSPPAAPAHNPRSSQQIGVAEAVATPESETVETTDPGRAMVTGRWNDIGKFKGPVLRAVAARPPYFHDGSAATLMDVITFYDTRFQARFTDQEKADLLAFLLAL